MFTPDISLATLREMREKFGEKVYGKYGFVDAFNPNNGWVDTDVIGIDVGIMLLSAENLRTGNVWRWFMLNREIPRAMSLIGLNLYGARQRESVPLRKSTVAIKAQHVRSSLEISWPRSGGQKVARRETSG